MLPNFGWRTKYRPDVVPVTDEKRGYHETPAGIAGIYEESLRLRRLPYLRANKRIRWSSSLYSPHHPRGLTDSITPVHVHLWQIYENSIQMATFEEIRQKIDRMAANIKQAAPQVIAETATEYYKERFRKKDWDGVPWPEAKRPGSGGSLMNTIRPTLVSSREVRIGAGSPRVQYARIHNEGGMIIQIPTVRQRRFFWAMEHKENPSGKSPDISKTGKWAAMARAKKLTIKIPKRQYMGYSPILNDKIIVRLNSLVKQPFK